MLYTKTIVLSAINLIEGGTLTILNQCLSYLNSDPSMHGAFRIIALVHKKDMFHFENIEFMEFPNSKKSWLFRLYYEYIGFYFLSKRLKPFLWLSLHDMSPIVYAKRQAVYCHNPTPFYRTHLKDIKYSYKVFLFSLLYKYVYWINLKSNDYVIVQQQWIRNGFHEIYNLALSRIVVAHPNENNAPIERTLINASQRASVKLFFFPSLSRLFKNFEIVCEAANLLLQRGVDNYQVVLTIDGTEDVYSREIVKRYRSNSKIIFCGRLPYQEIFDFYAQTSCLIFPSKLETWGLPISEFIQFNKPMILADFPYAHEAASGANQAVFFNPDDAKQLSILMEKVLMDDLSDFNSVPRCNIAEPFAQSWKELFDILLR